MGVLRRWLSDPVYEGSLSELIGTALHADRFDEFTTQAREDGYVDIESQDVPSDYFEKVLSEEVENQFGNELRPFIELVSNAIDARPDDYDGEYAVGLDMGRSYVAVADQGESMGLEDLLQTLIVPFHSEKDASEDIGRFGVGFFSNLSYCLDNPGDATVTVDTNTGDEAYRTTFWSESPDVADLKVRIEPGSRWGATGTRVKVDGITTDLGDLTDYLDDYFGHFDPERAVIKHGFDQINERPDGDTYRDTVTLPGEDEPLDQLVRVTLDPTDGRGEDENGDVNTYAQGVYVDSRPTQMGTAHISLPPAVELVEGRNAFNRKSDRYRAAVDGVYDQVVDYATEQDDAWTVLGLRQLIPEIKKQMDHDFTDVQRELLADALFPDNTYVVEGDEMTADHQTADYTHASRFFGSGLDAAVHGSATTAEHAFWRQEFPGLDDMVADYTDELVDGDLDTVQDYADEHDIPFHNTDVLPEDTEYTLVDVDNDTPAQSPFLQTNGTMYVRRDHPYLQLPDHSPSKHALHTAHQRAYGLQGRDVENNVHERTTRRRTR